MLRRVVPLSRELRIGNRYCGSLDGVLFAYEGDISAESADLDRGATSAVRDIMLVYARKSQRMKDQ